MKYMRIVAFTSGTLCVQTSENKNYGFKQTTITHDDFVELMKNEFPKFFDDFLRDYKNEYPEEFSYECARYFYHYGETREMIRKGEAYIFEK